MHKKLFGFLFLLMSFGVWGQTTLVNYQFNNNLNPEAGEIGSPILSYHASNGSSKVPVFNANMLSTTVMGDYLELGIDTSGRTGLILSFYADFSANIGFTGSWTVEANTGIGNNFEEIGSIDFWYFFLFGYTSGTLSINLPPEASKSDLKIRIKSEASAFGPRLRLDNLKITSGNPNIRVSSAANVHIPHLSPASVALTTDFGTRQTTDPALSRDFRVRNYLGEIGSILNVTDITVTGANPGDFTVTPTELLNINPTTNPNGGSTTYKTFTISFQPLADGIRTAEINLYSNAAPSPYKFTVVGVGASCNLETNTYAINMMSMVDQSLTGNYTTGDLISGQSSPANSNSLGTFLYPQGHPLYTSSSFSIYVRGTTEKTFEFGGANGIDISDQKNLSIQFNLAVFTTKNSLFDNYGVNSDASVYLEVWNPNTSTWSNEMRLIGGDTGWFGDNQYRYDFSGGQEFAATYGGNNPVTTVTNTSGGAGSSGAYKRFKLNIPASANIQNLKFRIRAHTNADHNMWLFDDVRIVSDNAVYKTYTTTGNWVPSAPTANEKVVIQGNYTVPNGGLNVCECEVLETGTLTIPSNSTMSVRGKITNHHPTGDNFVVQNNANLLQTEDAAVNVGPIKVEKRFTFNDSDINNVRKQYNFVISPVVGQNIKTIYDGNPTVIQYRESDNFFYSHNGAYTAGKGLAIKEPSKTEVSDSTVTAEFSGLPFNGELIYPLERSNTGNMDYGFNLIGNPYPSNLDILQLYQDNKNLIESTFYFWDNRGNTLYTQQGSDYQGANYAIYNAVSGTGLPAGAAAPGAPAPARIPNQYVKVGTGFIVQAKSEGNIRFKNSYRSNDNSGPAFFGKYMNQNSLSAEHATDINTENENQKDRYWLTLTTMSGMEFMNAVVYFDEGTNEYAADDSDAMGASDEIFTLVGQQYLAINGRAPFENTDVVPLGVRHFADGKYIIEIDEKEGIFANGQKIYLKDNYLNKLHELTLGYYEYESEAGEFIDRFEILYKNPGVTDPVFTASNLNHLKISKENHHIVIDSSIDKITAVEIFNLAGWSIYKKDNVNSQEHKVAAQSLGKGIIIVNVVTEKGEVVSRKFINN